MADCVKPDVPTAHNDIAEPGSPDHLSEQDAGEEIPQREVSDGQQELGANGLRIINATLGWLRRGLFHKETVRAALRDDGSGDSREVDLTDPGDVVRTPGHEPNCGEGSSATLSWLTRLLSRSEDPSQDGFSESGSAPDSKLFVDPVTLCSTSETEVPGAEQPTHDSGPAAVIPTDDDLTAGRASSFRRISRFMSRSKESPVGDVSKVTERTEHVSEDRWARSAEVGAIKSRVVDALVGGIRMVSAERDRDEIIRWFVNAREILGHGGSQKQIAKALYDSVDTKRFAELLGHTALTSVRNYKASNLPLALKVALPVTVLGGAFVGAQGAGVAAFGGAIGLPVILLLFLGTAGATAVVEAFVKDRSVRDPLTKLLLSLVVLETARRAKKELVAALRADATVPERAAVPEEDAALLAQLMTMDPTAFERHVMSFFQNDGYPVGVTQRSNDFGVDGYVLHPDGLIIVQCKRYAIENSVGRPEIQQFKGVIEEQQALKGYFVTTSRFTREARDSAAKSNRLILVDGEELLKWHKAGRSR